MADGLLDELPDFIHGGDQAVGGRGPQGAQFELGQGQALPHTALEISGQAQPFPFFGEG